MNHDWTPENSSNIAGASYDADAKELSVTFASGGTWIYQGVPAETYEGLKSADSAGSYLHRNIKGRYGHRRD